MEWRSYGDFFEFAYDCFFLILTTRQTSIAKLNGLMMPASRSEPQLIQIMAMPRLVSGIAMASEVLTSQALRTMVRILSA